MPWMLKSQGQRLEAVSSPDLFFCRWWLTQDRSIDATVRNLMLLRSICRILFWLLYPVWVTIWALEIFKNENCFRVFSMLETSTKFPGSRAKTMGWCVAKSNNARSLTGSRPSLALLKPWPVSLIYREYEETVEESKATASSLWQRLALARK